VTSRDEDKTIHDTIPQSAKPCHNDMLSINLSVSLKFPPKKEGSKKVNKKEKTIEPANARKNLDPAGLNVYSPLFFPLNFLL
jgi:hypothetical protein